MLKTAAIIFFLLLIPPLLLRFRPRWVAAFNLKVTNRITAPFATWLPGFGVITHIGRKPPPHHRPPPPPPPLPPRSPNRPAPRRRHRLPPSLQHPNKVAHVKAEIFLP